MDDRSGATVGTDAARRAYQEQRRSFWDTIWSRPGTSFASRYYHRRLSTLYRFLVPSGSRVLELGCGQGDLLAELRPKEGVGVDFSAAALEVARARHSNLRFVHGDAHDTAVEDHYDVVILSDLINDVWDVQEVFEAARAACRPDSRLIVNSFNRVWQLPISLARRLGLARPMLKQNWLSVRDVTNLLELAGLEVVSTSGEILWPISTPIVDTFFNRFLVKLWPFNHLGLTQFVVARPRPPRAGVEDRQATVSVVVPARNEAGHIREIIERTPRMGASTELIFVEGNSTDDTFEVIKSEVERLGDPSVRYYRQPGSGKGDAVRHGYAHASGEILMILDADMTVAPEDLPRFYQALVDGTGEFINGVRLVYPMEEEAMQFLNYLGNRLFGAAFTWLLRQPVKDTLCGTKVLTRKSYELIAANRPFFGDFDPFGDFDLLFGAAKANLKIVDLPIRYRQRRYGETNIDRWRHGLLLLRMTAFAARKLKFV